MEPTWLENSLPIIQGYLMETVLVYEIQTALWYLLCNILVILDIYLTLLSPISHFLQREKLYLCIEYKYNFLSSLILKKTCPPWMLFTPGSHIRCANCEGSGPVVCTQIFAWDCVRCKQPCGAILPAWQILKTYLCLHLTINLWK